MGYEVVYIVSREVVALHHVEARSEHIGHGVLVWYQIVFSDTPGVLSPKYKMQESMLAFSEGALTDADVLLYVTDVVEDTSVE